MAGTLRITGGKLVRKRINVPEDADKGLVRPTPDRVREAIFSSLGSIAFRATVLDLFAGSGIYAFESISRGAQLVQLVEKSSAVFRNIKVNIVGLGLDDVCTLVKMDALRFVQLKPVDQFDLVFVDPPYKLELPSEFWQHLRNWLSPDATVVYRCFPKAYSDAPEGYECHRDKSYGNTRVLFLSPIDN